MHVPHLGPWSGLLAVAIAIGSAAAQSAQSRAAETSVGTAAESVAPTEPAAAYDAQAVPSTSSWGPVSENANFVRPLRLGAGVLGGTLAAATVGGLGYLVTLPIFCSGSTGGFGSLCVLSAVAVGGLGALVAQPLGTWLTGTLLNGDGNIFATLPGPLVGLAVTAFLFQRDGQGLLWWSIAGAGVAGLVSAIGFELTSNTSASAAREHRLSVVPTILPGTGGGVAPGMALGGVW